MMEDPEEKISSDCVELNSRGSEAQIDGYIDRWMDRYTAIETDRYLYIERNRHIDR